MTTVHATVFHVQVATTRQKEEKRVGDDSFEKLTSISSLTDTKVAEMPLAGPSDAVDFVTDYAEQVW